MSAWEPGGPTRPWGPAEPCVPRARPPCSRCSTPSPLSERLEVRGEDRLRLGLHPLPQQLNQRRGTAPDPGRGLRGLLGAAETGVSGQVRIVSGAELPAAEGIGGAGVACPVGCVAAAVAHAKEW